MSRPTHRIGTRVYYGLRGSKMAENHAMTTDTREAGHTSGWLLRDGADWREVDRLSREFLDCPTNAGMLIGAASRLRDALDAALFRLSCSPCGECGGTGHEERRSEFGKIACAACCLTFGRSRWSELRIAPGFVPVRCEACVDGGVVVASIEGRSLEALCPAGCFKGWRVAP